MQAQQAAGLAGLRPVLGRKLQRGHALRAEVHELATHLHRHARAHVTCQIPVCARPSVAGISGNGGYRAYACCGDTHCPQGEGARRCRLYGACEQCGLTSIMTRSKRAKVAAVGEWMVAAMVVPSSLSPATTFITSLAVKLSRPDVGSSRNSTRGLVMRAMPICGLAACWREGGRLRS